MSYHLENSIFNDSEINWYTEESGRKPPNSAPGPLVKSPTIAEALFPGEKLQEYPNNGEYRWYYNMKTESEPERIWQFDRDHAFKQCAPHKSDLNEIHLTEAPFYHVKQSKQPKILPKWGGLLKKARGVPKKLRRIDPTAENLVRKVELAAEAAAAAGVATPSSAVSTPREHVIPFERLFGEPGRSLPLSERATNLAPISPPVVSPHQTQTSTLTSQDHMANFLAAVAAGNNRVNFENTDQEHAAEKTDASKSFYGGVKVEEAPTPFHQPIVSQLSGYGDIREGCEEFPMQWTSPPEQYHKSYTVEEAQALIKAATYASDEPKNKVILEPKSQKGRLERMRMIGSWVMTVENEAGLKQVRKQYKDGDFTKPLFDIKKRSAPDAFVTRSTYAESNKSDASVQYLYTKKVRITSAAELPLIAPTGRWWANNPRTVSVAPSYGEITVRKSSSPRNSGSPKSESPSGPPSSGHTISTASNDTVTPEPSSSPSSSGPSIITTSSTSVYDTAHESDSPKSLVSLKPEPSPSLSSPIHTIITISSDSNPGAPRILQRAHETSLFNDICNLGLVSGYPGRYRGIGIEEYVINGPNNDGGFMQMGDKLHPNFLFNHNKFYPCEDTDLTDWNEMTATRGLLSIEHGFDCSSMVAGHPRTDREEHLRTQMHLEASFARLEGVGAGQYRYYQGHLSVEEYKDARVCVCWTICACSKMCTRFPDVICPCSDHIEVLEQ